MFSSNFTEFPLFAAALAGNKSFRSDSEGDQTGLHPWFTPTPRSVYGRAPG